MIASQVLFAALLAYATFSVHAGEVYKWVDESGQVHFTDRPPSLQAEKLDLKFQSVPSTPALSEAQRAERQRRLLDAFAKERAETKSQAEAALAQKELRQRNCATARERRKELREASYLYDHDEAGNRVILDDQERHRAEEQAETAVRKWCD